MTRESQNDEGNHRKTSKEQNSAKLNNTWLLSEEWGERSGERAVARVVFRVKVRVRVRVRVGVRVRVRVGFRVSQGLNWLLPKGVVRIAHCSGKSHVLFNRAHFISVFNQIDLQFSPFVY